LAFQKKIFILGNKKEAILSFEKKKCEILSHEGLIIILTRNTLIKDIEHQNFFWGQFDFI